MTPIRIGCCFIPEFPIALWLQTIPSLTNAPLAIAEEEGESAALVLCNRKALEFGVTPELTVAQAHTLCPGLKVKVRDKQQEANATRDIVEILRNLSPFVQSTEDGLFYLNGSGLRFIYDSETTFARQIITRLQAAKLPASVGIASNKFIARVAAQMSAPGNIQIVPTNGERPFLKPLSVDLLPISPETRSSLYELGLRTIGQVKAFPLNELMERFAADGMLLSRLANGDDPDNFLPEFPPELLVKRLPLSFPLFHVGSLCLYVERILERMLERLRQAGRCTRHIDIICRLEDRSDITLTIALDQPSGTLPPFMRQLHQQGETIDLTSGVVDITVSIPGSSVLLLEQLSFQQKSTGGASGDTEQQLTRLTEEYRCCRPHLRAAHLPEQNFRLLPATEKVKREPIDRPSLQPYTGHSLSGLRLLQPPLAGDLINTGTQSMLLRIKQKLYTIERTFGPWKLSGEWWQSGFDRLYYEVQTTDRKFYLIFYDRIGARWFIQGVFD
ncbi:MAG: DNA polymerase Y family protein [bacterium]|nr:DNA polymerase Y family protein [bacterium]